MQYHNTEYMGYPCDEGNGDYFSIVTNKSVANLPGNRVWLISGEGKPRKYSLCEVFIVDEVGRDASDNYASGTVGTAFRPPIPLNSLTWFKDFLKRQQNFRFGLNEIGEKSFIRELERLAGGIEQPSVERSLKVGAAKQYSAAQGSW